MKCQKKGGDPYLFTLKTRTEIYYCGERDSFDQNGVVSLSDPKSGKGTRIAIAWAEEIKSAFQSVSANQQTLTALHPEFSEEEKEKKQVEANTAESVSCFKILVNIKSLK